MSQEIYALCQEIHTILDHGKATEVEKGGMAGHSCNSFYTDKSHTHFIPWQYRLILQQQRRKIL